MDWRRGVRIRSHSSSQLFQFPLGLITHPITKPVNPIPINPLTQRIQKMPKIKVKITPPPRVSQNSSKLWDLVRNWPNQSTVHTTTIHQVNHHWFSNGRLESTWDYPEGNKENKKERISDVLGGWWLLISLILIERVSPKRILLIFQVSGVSFVVFIGRRGLDACPVSMPFIFLALIVIKFWVRWMEEKVLPPGDKIIASHLSPQLHHPGMMSEMWLLIVALLLLNSE